MISHNFAAENFKTFNWDHNNFVQSVWYIFKNLQNFEKKSWLANFKIYYNASGKYL